MPLECQIRHQHSQKNRCSSLRPSRGHQWGTPPPVPRFYVTFKPSMQIWLLCLQTGLIWIKKNLQFKIFLLLLLFAKIVASEIFPIFPGFSKTTSISARKWLKQILLINFYFWRARKWVKPIFLIIFYFWRARKWVKPIFLINFYFWRARKWVKPIFW
jgi:hypothetical protein